MLANLRALFAVVVDIVLLRRGPDDLPASPALLGVVVAVFLAVSALTGSMIPDLPDSWMLHVLADVVFMMLWYRAGLTLANKRERAVQTITAIVAVAALFTPFLLPLSVQVQPYYADPEHVPAPPVLVQLSAVILAIWVLTLMVRIVRSAFEWRLFPSILFVLAQNFASAVMLGMLFGASTPAT